MSRTPSPADVRCHLDPDTVDVLADQLHTLNCVPLIGDTARPAPDHRVYDLSRARFLLLGLHEAGWALVRS